MKKRIILLSVVLVLLVIGAGIGYYAYRIFMVPNINADPNSATYKYLYVEPNDSWDDVINKLKIEGWIRSAEDLQVCIKYMEPENPKCGKYDIEPNVDNRSFVNRLAYGISNDVTVSLKMTRYTTWVARNLSRQLAVDSASLADVLLADTLLQKFNLDKESSLALFVRFDSTAKWGVSARDVEKMIVDARNRFWTADRLEKAKKTNLSLKEIHILASIVEEETNDYNDRRMVAGVYLNRLKRKMPLQACPTARYASGDFTLNRVLKKHTEIDSPYNTYKYAGLPPGPIRIPTHNAIDAVLNFESHNYLYFCAKSDFSGTHNYATNYNEHKKNARAYQKALNKRLKEQKQKK